MDFDEQDIKDLIIAVQTQILQSMNKGSYTSTEHFCALRDRLVELRDQLRVKARI
jgi:hypothetical protein